ncbi:hypothetical protein ARAF_0297 [Arsenophonus endosymbiont of Aleurodicus floccissimus]|uniref:DUF1283 domain-containing protein n=1 Tax=Arsenophonus endosymbiont of Aleurodicus floccissimus TaxID=2152761 RepID=UPI000E6B4828|nr:hypothetical protein ARAF_0297 [Arsenophonus endosymbiont of Aleurodicus floccissimus]
MSKSISISALLACYLCSGAVSAVELFVYDGNSALTKEQAREQSEQWNEIKLLRKKVNQRAERVFDKADNESEACYKSGKLNAYWESKTRSCLDSNTGKHIRP